MKFAAILLGAGQSKRFGPENKLLSDHKGQPLIRHSMNLILNCTFEQRLLVTGYEREKMQTDQFEEVFNPKFASGMGTSLAAGFKKLKPNIDGAFVFLGDMPHISKDLVGKMQAVFEPPAIVAPCHKGRRGHPLLFSKDYFPLLTQLTNDQGGRDIIKSHLINLKLVQWNDESIFFDVDTNQAKENL